MNLINSLRRFIWQTSNRCSW